MNFATCTGVLFSAISVGFLLAACAESPKLNLGVDHVRLDAPDASALKRCPDPVKVPAGPLTQKQVEALWGADTDHLIECGGRHRILVDYITTRDAGLSPAAKTK